MNIASVITALAVAVGVATSTSPRRAQTAGGNDVPVQLVLDQARYVPGAHGHVRVRTGEDGYLVVLFAQPDGHVEVAYPIDPSVSDAVRGDTEIQIVSRGAREAFTVEDSSGMGTWYAAISKRPFHFDDVSVHGHWDYRAVPRETNADQVESELTSFVRRLSTGRFDYDIVSFVIDRAATPSSSAVDPTPPSGLPQGEPNPGGSATPGEPTPAEPSPGDATPGEWGPQPWSWGGWWPRWIIPWTWYPPTGVGPYYDRMLPSGAAAHPGSTQTPAPPTHSAPATPSDAHEGHGGGGGGGGGGGRKGRG